MSVKSSFIGFIGKDAEVVNTQTNSFISFSVGVSDKLSNNSGTTWVQVIARMDMFKNMLDYLKKGRHVSVDGATKYNAYIAKNGEAAPSVSVYAYNIDFVSSGSKNDDTESSSNNSNTVSNVEVSTGTLRGSSTAKPESQPVVAAASSIADDDLPF